MQPEVASENKGIENAEDDESLIQIYFAEGGLLLVG